ncbi:MAG: hypothetical protein WD771_05665 [Gemmatimonadaceae bacterium]
MRSLYLVGALVPVLFLPRSPALAQGGTDVWVATLAERGSALTVGTPRNLTARAGYDNQPSFTPDGSAVLFTSIRDDGQSDIWRVAVAGGAPRRVTATAESEYSATATPDGRGFTVIRVEADSTQRLWRFLWDGSAPTLILPGLKPVGYHVWVSDGALGAFVLGSPNALVLADPRTDRVDTLARRIGRAFARVPGRDAFTFAQLVGDTVWFSEVDVRTRGVRRLMVAPPGGEYHVWTPNGQLIATAGSRLYRWTDGRWDVLADFAVHGIRGISRIALSPRGDQVAFVTEDRPTP